MYEKVLSIFKQEQNENINFKKKKRELLTKEHQETYKNGRICYICQEKFEHKYLKDKKYCMARDHFNYTRENSGAVHSICKI